VASQASALRRMTDYDVISRKDWSWPDPGDQSRAGITHTAVISRGCPRGMAREALAIRCVNPGTFIDLHAPRATRVGTAAASSPSRQRTFNRSDPERRLRERPCRRENFRSGLKRSRNAPLIPLTRYRVGSGSQLAAPYAIGANKPCPQYQRSTVNHRKTRS
jgi:hypothetical protein